jgi:hypothetical protein
MAYLESVFPGRLISKRLWPPRSPDLSPPDFLLWGHLKDTVYSHYPHTLQGLQANIQRTVDRISTGTLQNVFVNMIRRVHLCEERKIYIAFLRGFRDFLNTLYLRYRDMIANVVHNGMAICFVP